MSECYKKEVKLMADLSNTNGYISLKVLWDMANRVSLSQMYFII